MKGEICGGNLTVYPLHCLSADLSVVFTFAVVLLVAEMLGIAGGTALPGGA